MYSELKKIAKHSSVYGLGMILQFAMSFILLPLYLSVLPANEIGILEIINRTINLLKIITIMGLGVTLIRFYQEKEDDCYKKSIISTSMIFIISVCAIICFVIFVNVKHVSLLLFGTTQNSLYINLMIGILFFETLFTLSTTYFIVQVKSIIYVLISLLKLILGVSIILYFVLVHHMGLKGVLYGNFIHIAILSSILVVYIILKVGIKFNLSLLKSMIMFGLPFIPGSFFLFVLNSGDRYILAYLLSNSEVGIYAIGYRVGEISTLVITTPFLRVWSALYMKYYKEDDSELIFNRFLVLPLFLYCVIALVISLFSREVLYLIGDPVYQSSVSVIPLVVIAYFFWSMSLIIDCGFYITKKTKYKPMILLISSIVFVALCFPLILKFGYIGAALSLIIAYVLSTIISANILNRIFSIPYYYFKVSMLIVVWTIVYYLTDSILNQEGVLALINLNAIDMLYVLVLKILAIIVFTALTYYFILHKNHLIFQRPNS